MSKLGIEQLGHNESIEEPNLERVNIDNNPYFRIAHVDKMRPFFMSVVSDSNHWMFLSSNGGISAGRKDAQQALFPYITDDKITAAAETTGCKSIFNIRIDNDTHLWEPYSSRNAQMFHIQRNLYKSFFGNEIIFEEINHNLNLTFRYRWAFSNLYGFTRYAELKNDSDKQIDVAILDGLQNILPYGVNSDLQLRASNLVDAYKRCELIPESGIGIYALSANIVDKAEPSEALLANIVWSMGLENARILLSNLQLEHFRLNGSIKQETDVKAEKGAYFVNAEFSIPPNQEKKWTIIANVNQSQAAIIDLNQQIKSGNNLEETLIKDNGKGTERLLDMCISADGLQLSDDHRRTSRHFSNTLFNLARGGVFDFNYEIEKVDFTDYLKKANQAVFKKNCAELNKFPDHLHLFKLKKWAEDSDDLDLLRLTVEYMPLRFSRRHGDPSRPWNKFSINTHSEIDGSKVLDYEGNWRDIFQNWEALAHSFPHFVESMIFKFLNATTFDGYNPYRITKDGFDWEIIEPDDPWSYIGYWGDHQIIYLLKFLEFIESHTPGKLAGYFNQPCFVYANVPYKIKPYEDILKNAKDTIDFDNDLDKDIGDDRKKIGADGALLRNKADNTITRSNFIEKILATVLAKLSNFIPEGGIWMNTQRPEWNDANNALVGNGVSMVTLYYLRRFLDFFHDLCSDENLNGTKITVSTELARFFSSINETFQQHAQLLSKRFDDKERKEVLDKLGLAGSRYRWDIYDQGFTGDRTTINVEDLIDFLKLSNQYLEHSIKVNKREDGMYHAYNLMTIKDDKTVSISYLSEMLEGQVAVLSSGFLSPVESLQVLNALADSKLYREDQKSYMLYPNKDLPGFMSKNSIPAKQVEGLNLITDGNYSATHSILESDINGNYHFNGKLSNASDLEKVLSKLSNIYKEKDWFTKEKDQILALYESVFNHKAFTGRSGTFFGYEGLGSIYWHMVSKLLLAVQECFHQAVDIGTSRELLSDLAFHYRKINEGIGAHKSPSQYGAFPTDPYSHTPLGKGVQQPGMTGQVKEDILCRYGELGISVFKGKLGFKPRLLQKHEFLNASQKFEYSNTSGQKNHLLIEEGALCFTYCQVPIIYKCAEKEEVKVTFDDGSTQVFEALSLDVQTSREIFARTGKVVKICAFINSKILL